MKRLLLFICALALLLPATALAVNASLSVAVDKLASQASVIKSAPRGADVTFTDADFRQALGVPSYPSLTIVTLPDPREGVLKLGNLRLSAGQVVRRSDVSRLVFSPSGEQVTEAAFSFRAGNLCGGAVLDCILRFTDKANTAPTAAGTGQLCGFSTRKNTSLWGTMASYDPDGDDLEYLIVTYPKKGTLTVTDAATGDFRYTPQAGYAGKDSFSYVVRDSYGNYSSIATVEITVDRHTRDLSFSDMSDTAAADAACRMVSADIMEAEYEGYAVYFHPRGTMTRAAFLVAAMKATGHTPRVNAPLLFDDTAAVPAAIPYVCTAAAAGYVTPEWHTDGLYFRPEDTVTCAEAAEMLSRMLPAPLTGIDPGICTSDEPLTRAQAALLLLAASRIIG